MSDQNRLRNVSRLRPFEKVVVLSIHGYVSIYRRSATLPLGLRWGFKTISNQRIAISIEAVIKPVDPLPPLAPWNRQQV
jgi:hypothetical protein